MKKPDPNMGAVTDVTQQVFPEYWCGCGCGRVQLAHGPSSLSGLTVEEVGIST